MHQEPPGKKLTAATASLVQKRITKCENITKTALRQSLFCIVQNMFWENCALTLETIKENGTQPDMSMSSLLLAIDRHSLRFRIFIRTSERKIY